MTVDNMPLEATQKPAECGVDAFTIDDTREEVMPRERASVALKEFFPQWVKWQRQRAGQTQYDLGRLSGLGRGAIAQYEQGRRIPWRRSVQRLLDAFHITGVDRAAVLRWLPDDARGAEKLDETALHRAFGGDVE